MTLGAFSDTHGDSRGLELSLIHIFRSGEDAAAFLLAGASAVMVGSANFADPYACPRIIRELEAYLASQGLSSVCLLYTSRCV